LFDHADHAEQKTFDLVSKGYLVISLDDLVAFLEHNGYYPRSDELEAILRRCDHDGDSVFTFEEWLEITGPGSEPEPAIAEGSNLETPAARRSTTTLHESPIDKRNREVAEWKEEQERAREEKERKMAEAKEANRRHYESVHKLVSFLTDKFTEHVNLDYQKKLLTYHGSFGLKELFKQIDADNDLNITADELRAFFAGDEDLEDFNFENLVKYWAPRGGDKINFSDFQHGLSPYRGAGLPGLARHSDEDQKSQQEKTWRAQLKLVIYLQGQLANSGETASQSERIMSEEEVNKLWFTLDLYDDKFVSASVL